MPDSTVSNNTDPDTLKNTELNVQLAAVREHAYPGDMAVVRSEDVGVVVPPRGLYTGDTVVFSNGETYQISKTYYAPDAIIVKTDMQAEYTNVPVWLILSRSSTVSQDSYLSGDGFLAAADPDAFNWWPSFDQPYTDANNSDVNPYAPPAPVDPYPYDPSDNPYDTPPRPCYLAGVQIQTEIGLKNVEDIKVGDNVVTWLINLVDNQLQQVIWCGHGHTTVDETLPDDVAGWPVRICKGAIADNVPFRDLLVTAEHGLFLNGKFVPARMLVNGMSIVFDKSIKEYTFYHIETQHHSIIKADGMWSETYLDVGGNRLGFELGTNVFPLSRNLRWEENGAALVAYERDFVEPIFRTLAKRAISLGYKETVTSPELTNEHDLHLLANNGERIEPSREWNGHISFVIPDGVTDVRIMSRSSRPSDIIGPFENQRNMLGVAIGNIYLFDQYGHKSITEHLTKKNLSGWYNLEWEDTRWTRGNAHISLGRRDTSGSALLILQVKATGPYLAKPLESRDLRAS